MTMVLPDGENDTPRDVPLVGPVDGSLYRVPNPALQGYADTHGGDAWATATTADDVGAE
jgi:hypothetical protein